MSICLKEKVIRISNERFIKSQLFSLRLEVNVVLLPGPLSNLFLRLLTLFLDLIRVVGNIYCLQIKYKAINSDRFTALPGVLTTVTS